MAEVTVLPDNVHIPVRDGETVVAALGRELQEGDRLRRVLPFGFASDNSGRPESSSRRQPLTQEERSKGTTRWASFGSGSSTSV